MIHQNHFQFHYFLCFYLLMIKDVYFTHFQPETKKFICNGKIIDDNEILPSDTTLVALAIVPVKNNNDLSCKNILN